MSELTLTYPAQPVEHPEILTATEAEIFDDLVERLETSVTPELREDLAAQRLNFKRSAGEDNYRYTWGS